MDRKKICVRGVDPDAWEALVEVREDSRTSTGKLISDALRLFADEYFLNCDADTEPSMLTHK